MYLMQCNLLVNRVLPDESKIMPKYTKNIFVGITYVISFPCSISHIIFLHIIIVFFIFFIPHNKSSMR
jgi:hypothetical protein